MSQPMTPPPPPGPAPGQNKMSPLAWVAIGCGVLIVVCLVVMAGVAFVGGRFLKKEADKLQKNPAFAVAELAIRANPEVELVSTDEDKGTLTIRNKKTGEEMTMNADQAKEGKFTFTTKEGTATLDASGTKENGVLKMTNEKGEQATFGFGMGAPRNLPSWVPVYPGAEAKGSYDATGPQGRNASFTVTTTDSVDKVADYYEAQLKSAGLGVQKNTMEAENQKTVILVGSDSDNKRTCSVSISTSEGKTQALVNFTVTEKK